MNNDSSDNRETGQSLAVECIHQTDADSFSFVRKKKKGCLGSKQTG